MTTDTLELLEIIEHETLVDTQPELLTDAVEAGDEVADAADHQLLLGDELELLVVDQEVQTILLEAGAQGPPGLTGGTGGAIQFELTAAVALGGHRVVRSSGVEAVYADNTQLSDANLVLGITAGAAIAGAPVRIQASGLMTEPSWAWTPDQPVFCGANGVLVQPAPALGFSLVVAVALAPTRIHIGAKMPIVLN